MKSAEQLYMEEYVEKQYKELANQHIKIQEYAMKEKASQSYIDSETMKIAKFKLFVDAVSNYIQLNQIDPQLEYKRGFENGYSTGQNETKNFYEGIPHPLERKETIRELNILRTKILQPQLFDSDKDYTIKEISTLRQKILQPELFLSDTKNII